MRRRRRRREKAVNNPLDQLVDENERVREGVHSRDFGVSLHGFER